MKREKVMVGSSVFPLDRMLRGACYLSIAFTMG
jgi:hypothetical protein